MGAGGEGQFGSGVDVPWCWDSWSRLGEASGGRGDGWVCRVRLMRFLEFGLDLVLHGFERINARVRTG